LIVRVGREDLGTLRRYRGVTLDERSEYAASGLDTSGEWATSRSRRSWVFSEVSPERMAAWTAAP